MWHFNTQSWMPRFRIKRIDSNVSICFLTSIAIMIFFLCDIVNVFTFFYHLPFDRVAIVPRTLFQLFTIVYVFRKGRASNHVFWLYSCCLILALSFCLGFGTFFANKVDTKALENIIHFGKMLFFFTCFAFFKDINSFKNSSELKFIFKAFEIIIIANACCIILGTIFEIHQFSSYGEIINGRYVNIRFGYKGLIQSANEASTFWLIALFYGLYISKKEGRYTIYVLSAICCMLLGPKAAALCCVLVLVSEALKAFLRPKYALVWGILLFCTILAIPFLVDLVQKIFRTAQLFEYYVARLDKGFDPVTVLFSGRDTFIVSKIPGTIEYWNPLNWLFGGQDRPKFLLEMDIFDTFLFFGIIGTTLYFFLYLHAFSGIDGRIRNLFVVTYFAMAFLNGHTFWSGMNAVYLAILIIKASSITKSRSSVLTLLSRKTFVQQPIIITSSTVSTTTAGSMS